MNPGSSLFGELKRRKVVRIAGGYLVVAWIVLQVAATLLPVFELPGWTVKLVAVLLMLGFPLALVLGWIFDLTPGGLERTTDAPTFHFPIRAATIGTLIVVAGVVGFLVVRNRLNAAGIDPNSVVVLPFRVSGDAGLAVMREGMVDLIVPKLTGVGGPRAVDSRTTLSAWRRAVTSETEDLAPKEAIKLARKLHAAQVILGEVVGTPGKIALNARVYSTIDGAASDPARVTTTRDSVLPAVDVLIAELLSRQAGEGDRLSALLTSSLPAVQSYLDGARNYRRGKYEVAAKNFGDAVDIDSTFALAAYGELMTRSWTGYGPRYTRATKLAFTFKDRMPPREKSLLLARVGEAYPKPKSYSGSVQGWEQVSTQYPDSPEVWYELGDHYFHNGQPLGMEDYEERALSAWSRAIALDSSYAPPWEHQIQIHATRGDTARLRTVYTKLQKMEAEEVRGAVGWVYALATKNDTMRARMLKEVPKWPRSSLPDAVLATSKAGVPATDLDVLVKQYVESASTDDQRMGAHYYVASYELNAGRPRAALAHLEVAARLPGAEMRTLNIIVVHSIAYPEMGREAAEKAMQRLRTQKNPEFACSMGLWEALNGRPEASAQIRRLMRDSMNNVPPRADGLRYCEQLIKAAEAVVGRQSTASSELQKMDSLIMNGPNMGPVAANNVAAAMARLYAQTGDFNRARQASLRGGYTTIQLSAQTLEHARMAARTGRREEAIRSYRIYLAMRDRPEPGPAQEVTDRVRAELAALAAR